MRAYATILVRATWDSEANVWVATSDDVPGLVTEADTIPLLEEKLQVMIPELLELSGETADGLAEIPLMVVAESLSRIRLRQAA